MVMPPPSRPKKRCICVRHLTATLNVHVYPDDFEGLWEYTDTRDPNAVSSVLVRPGQGGNYVSYYTLGGDIEWSLEIKDRLGCTDGYLVPPKEQEFERNVYTYGSQDRVAGDPPVPLTVVFPTGHWWLWLQPNETPPTREELFCNWDELSERFQGRLLHTVGGGGPPTLDPANLPPGVVMDTLLPQLYDDGALATSPFSCPGRQSIHVRAKCSLFWACSKCKKKGGTTPTLGGQVEPPINPLSSLDADCKNKMAESICVLEGWSTAAGHYNPFGGQDKLPGFATQSWTRDDTWPLLQLLLCDPNPVVGHGGHSLWNGLKLCPQILPLTLRDNSISPILLGKTGCEDLEKWCKLISEQGLDIAPLQRYKSLPRNPR